MRENTLRTLFAQKKLAINAWASIGSPALAAYMGDCGYDAVTVDLQHGLFSIETAVSMIQAISATASIPIARCSENAIGEINKLLDAGAYAIICPLINSQADAEKFVQACRYAPLGGRSYGPALASVYAGKDYYTQANATIITLAMIESVQGLAALDDILSVPNLDGIYIGPSDLAIDMGFAPDAWKTPAVDAAIKKIIAATHAHHKYVGIFAGTTEMAQQMKSYGVDMVSPGTDMQLVRAEADHRLRHLR
jgi:4-hydroxy-2-oxoheptanedioate aldolase